MARAAFVGGDWGTSHLRLFLCDAHGTPLEQLSGPGAAEARSKYPALLARLLQPWLQRHGPLPVILCGMVGSTVGWTQVPYVDCPAGSRRIAAGSVLVGDSAARVVPGLRCCNRLEAPDVMRGEETQALGALRLRPELQTGEHLLCLPGTHTKWAVLAGGELREFLTAPTGELFALLTAHGILVRDDHRAPPAPVESTTRYFQMGLERAGHFPQAELLHRLFECRSRRLCAELTEAGAPAFLSGLLVGSDVRGALRLLSPGGEGCVYIIGEARISGLYDAAVRHAGRIPLLISGERAVCAGLHELLQLTRAEEGLHAV